MANLREKISVDLQRNGAGTVNEIAQRIGARRQSVARVLDDLLGDGVVVFKVLTVLRMSQCRGLVVQRRATRLFMLALPGRRIEDLLRETWT